MSYAQDAEALLTQQPVCQSIDPHTLMADCEPACKHEQLQVQRAQVYTQLEISNYLDTIAARLQYIADHQ